MKALIITVLSSYERTYDVGRRYALSTHKSLKSNFEVDVENLHPILDFVLTANLFYKESFVILYNHY